MKKVLFAGFFIYIYIYIYMMFHMFIMYIFIGTKVNHASLKNAG